MKKTLTVLLLSLPAGVQAMGMHGNMGGCAPAASGHLAVGLYALLAALGYWVLQHAAKETAKYSKRAGQLVGWVLIASGLAGLLCGVAAHAKMAGGHKCGGPDRMTMQREGQPRMMGMEGMGDMKPAQDMKVSPEGKPAAKKPDAAPKNK